MFDDMAVSRISVIQGRGVELHHLFRIRRDARYYFHLAETVEAEMIVQPLSQGRIGFYRKYASVGTNERCHQQRMPTDIRTDIQSNSPQGKDGPEYPSD